MSSDLQLGVWEEPKLKVFGNSGLVHPTFGHHRTAPRPPVTTSPPQQDKYRTAAERSGGTRLSFGGGAELPGGGLAAGAAAGATSGSQSSRRASFAGNQVTRALLVGATPPSAPRSTSAVRGVSAGGRSSLGGGAQGLQGVQEEGAASAGPKRAFLRKGTGGAGIVRQTADDDVLASVGGLVDLTLLLHLEQARAHCSGVSLVGASVCVMGPA